MGFSEIWKILDWDEKKPVPELNMTKLGLKLFNDYKYEENEVCQTGYKIDQNQSDYDKWRRAKDEFDNSHVPGTDDNIYGHVRNEAVYLAGAPRKPVLREFTQEAFDKYKNWKFIGGQRYNPKMDSMLFEFYNIKPFEPWVMLNISPDWAGLKVLKQKGKIKNFIRMFETYMKEGWYSEWKFVLEAGGNGDHLHLHSVCKMGSDLKQLKSVRTHLSKNWKRQIMKYARDEGLEGVIKMPGLQCIIIQGENGGEILQDKIDYLDEDKKPGGHKNKTPNALKRTCGVLREGSLIDLLSS